MRVGNCNGGVRCLFFLNCMEVIRDYLSGELMKADTIGVFKKYLDRHMNRHNMERQTIRRQIGLF